MYLLGETCLTWITSPLKIVMSSWECLGCLLQSKTTNIAVGGRFILFGLATLPRLQPDSQQAVLASLVLQFPSSTCLLGFHTAQYSP